jgi:hypothetical protein
MKRQATDKVDGEPRGKRKRVEPAPVSTRKEVVETEERASLVRRFSEHLYNMHAFLTP